MIATYGMSITGKAHMEDGRVCQDNHKIVHLDNGWTIAAIADGVGSCKHSEKASKIAVDAAVSVCKKCMPSIKRTSRIKKLIFTAFRYAQWQISKKAVEDEQPIDDYDTTLSLCIYDGNNIFYGHCGDGGIIARLTTGEYVEITTPQKGEVWSEVIPLRAGRDYWKIGSYTEEVAAVLMATDGIRDVLCPYLLYDQGQQKNHVYAPLASFFADKKSFMAGNRTMEQTVKKITRFVNSKECYSDEEFYSRLKDIYRVVFPKRWKRETERIRKNNYPVAMFKRISDDKTIVGLINTEAVIRNTHRYSYKEPDWYSLKQELFKNIYKIGLG